MPAPVQITAEQLLREAKERELELVQAVSSQVYYVYKENYINSISDIVWIRNECIVLRNLKWKIELFSVV